MNIKRIKKIYNLESTIAAIATAPGEGAIGIVRLSGKNALKIADKIFVCPSGKKPSEFKTRTIHYGWIAAAGKKKLKNKISTDNIIDETLLTVMKAPFTYTRQDIVEINCHGGVLALKKTLELVLEKGAVLAEPGEFTKRAFLNGRIDLTQAEAVLDIIRAKTEAGLDAALGQLKGRLSEKIEKIKNVLMNALANLEASFDFSQHDISVLDRKEITACLATVKKSLEELIENSEKGCVLREGITTVICGKPNVGKSSLMNAFLREDKVIVTPIAGTTRDAIEDIINIKGIPLKIVDTAGIIEPRDLVEKEGIKRSKKYLKEAHLILFVLDNSRVLSQEDFQIIEEIKDRPVMVVINKIDLKTKLDFKKIKDFLKDKSIVKICALKEKGMPQLEESIRQQVLGGKAFTDRESILVTNLRHKKLLEKSLEFARAAGENLKTEMKEELAAEDIREVLKLIGSVVGEVTPEDILNKIFEEFCVGK
ncbi:MAG: tRNA uridine-5-carboxymethylaminomethyl(34) synthesis GTPase MnmE [Candidatus Omnitrophota bacterium]